MVFNWFNHLGVQKKMIISNLLIIIVPFVVLITSLSMLWALFAIQIQLLIANG